MIYQSPISFTSENRLWLQGKATVGGELQSLTPTKHLLLYDCWLHLLIYQFNLTLWPCANPLKSINGMQWPTHSFHLNIPAVICDLTICSHPVTSPHPWLHNRSAALWCKMCVMNHAGCYYQHELNEGTRHSAEINAINATSAWHLTKERAMLRFNVDIKYIVIKL